ncbi:MAG: hypothetical protein ABSF68_16275, partial [Candidatus Acidiferrales bacterium]
IGCFGVRCTNPTAASDPHPSGILSELIRSQKEQGLGLASIFRGQAYIVEFSNRSLGLARDFQFKGTLDYGIVSPDGSEIALINRATINARYTLQISKPDGSDSRNYPELTSPAGMCWSNGNAKLALTSNYTDPAGQALSALQIVELGSRKTEAVDDMNSFTTSQCWSPDGKILVYAKNSVGGKQTVLTYDVQTKQKKELATGARASWIPTTEWITYLDCGVEARDCTYYAIHADGTGKKALFKTFAAVTGLSWSPDGRFGAYVSAGRKSEPKEVSWRVRVRRLQDYAEDWVANLADTDPIEFQWTTTGDLSPQSKSNSDP